MPKRARVAKSSAVEHPAFNRLVLEFESQATHIIALMTSHDSIELME